MIVEAVSLSSGRTNLKNTHIVIGTHLKGCAYCGAVTMATEPKYPLVSPNKVQKTIGQASLSKITTMWRPAMVTLQSRKRGTNKTRNRLREKRTNLLLPT